MIRIAIPFLLSELTQIPDLIKERNFLLEGIVFDANLFAKKNFWKKIEVSMAFLSKKFPNRLYSLHFPVDNADYLSSPIVKEYLYRFIDLAVSYKVQIIVIHSNYIKSLNTFNIETLGKKRKEYLCFFKILDRYIAKKNITLCVENMPIIGNHGNDVDSVFVLPQDFKEFNFSNIKIVWDIGHWAYTWSVLKSLNRISPYIKTINVRFNEFFLLKQNLAHFQLSSFKTIALPGTGTKCLEGIVPSDGDIDEHLLRDILLSINSWKNSYVVSLEIQDKDYTDRVNLFKTIKWLDEQIKQIN